MVEIVELDDASVTNDRNEPGFLRFLGEAGLHFHRYPKSNAMANSVVATSLFIRYNSRMAVTRRQKEILDFLESFVNRNGYSPSFEEIARGMSLKSLATVHKHITNLEKKGHAGPGAQSQPVD